MKKESPNKKIVVISGGMGYLGTFITRKLADNTFFVVILSRNTKGASLESLYGNSVCFIETDVTNTEAVKKASEEVKKRFGKIYAIVHAASAPLIRKPVLDESRDNFESQFSVNVVGAFNLFKYFCPNMIPNGAIIGITSRMIDTRDYYSPSGSYIPAKDALKGLLRVLFNELKNKLIRVYGVAPAFMPGGLNSDIPETVQEIIKIKSKPEEITSPEQVADVVVNLINDTKQEMNGKSVTVPDGIITAL